MVIATSIGYNSNIKNIAVISNRNHLCNCAEDDTEKTRYRHVAIC